MQSPQLETKGQQNKRIAVSPQLETKGQQNKQIVQQNGKLSPQLRAKVIQRKQQNVKQSPQLEFVQSETKSHQIKEMRKQADMQYRQPRNLQIEHQPDNRLYQPQQVDTSHQESSDDQTSREKIDRTINREDSQWMFAQNQQQHSKPYPQQDIRTCQPQQVNSSCKESSDDPTSGKGVVSAVSKDVMQYIQLETVLYKQQPSKHYPQLDIRTYQPQPVDTSRQESSDDQTSREELVNTINRLDDKQSPQWLIVPNQQQTRKPYLQLDIRIYQPQQVDSSHQESYDDPSSGKELVSTFDKVKSALAQLEAQRVEEAEHSVVLWNWIFNRLDPRPGILSTIKCQMAGESPMVSGFNVNLTKVQIAERRVTPPLMVTCSLENVMPAFVEESNLGSKFVIPGSAYSSTVEDTLQVVNTTYNCDTEPVLRTVVQYEIEIHTFEPSTSSPPGPDGQYAVVPRHMQDNLKYAYYEFTQDCHPQCSSSIEGIVWGTCTLIKYCQKVVMVKSSEGSDPETSRIWDPGGASRYVKKRLSRERDDRSWTLPQSEVFIQKLW